MVLSAALPQPTAHHPSHSPLLTIPPIAHCSSSPLQPTAHHPSIAHCSPSLPQPTAHHPPNSSLLTLPPTACCSPSLPHLTAHPLSNSSLLTLPPTAYCSPSLSFPHALLGRYLISCEKKINRSWYRLTCWWYLSQRYHRQQSRADYQPTANYTEQITSPQLTAQSRLPLNR